MVDARRKEATVTKALGTNEYDESIQLVGPPQLTPAEHVDRNEIASRCQRAIAALPERTRVVVTLFYYYGMSRGEMAFVLDTSADTIENEIKAAQRALRDLVHPASTRSSLRATLRR
jgi:RNA polymerase sigma-70 factor (ECF subfamily)